MAVVVPGFVVDCWVLSNESVKRLRGGEAPDEEPRELDCVRIHASAVTFPAFHR